MRPPAPCNALEKRLIQREEAKMASYGVMTEEQTQGVIQAICRTGTRTPEEIETVLKWANGIAIQTATLDLGVRGEIDLALSPTGEVLLSREGRK